MRKVLIYILALLLLLAAVLPYSVPVSAENIDRYGYSLLINDTQRKAYKSIAEGIAALDDVISIPIEGITQENVDAIGGDINVAVQAVISDYPEFFWLPMNENFGAVRFDGTEFSFIPTAYTVNGQVVTADSPALQSAKNSLEAVVNAAFAKLPSNPSEYDIALIFHDFVAEQVSYVASGDHQTAYGALVGKQAICAGYTRAYQLLLNRAGIKSWYVAGSSYDPTDTLVAHAWNLVYLGGKCYYTDVTWDDQNTTIFHEYLNNTLEEISLTHFTDAILPSTCNHKDQSYFVKNNGKGVCVVQGQETPADVAKCFELKSQNGNSVVYKCSIQYRGNDFEKWFNDNAFGIVQELKFARVDVNVIDLGKEYQMTLSGELKEVTTTPTEPSTPTTPPNQNQNPPTTPTTPSTSDPTTPSTPDNTTSTTPTTPTNPTTPNTPTNPTTTTTPNGSGSTTQPSAPTNPTQITNPPATDPSQGTEPSQSQDPTDGSVPASKPDSKPSVQPTTKPAGSTNSGSEENPGNMIVIVAIGVGVIAVVIGAIFLFRKKKV